jgi:hypothetical protein
MKRTAILFAILLSAYAIKTYAQCGGTTPKTTIPASIGIVICSNDVETVWNALRLANYSVNAGDTVKIFLLGKGVELDTLVKKNADIKEQADLFLKAGGTILGCGTCLQSRNNLAPQVCKMSSMGDLYDIVKKCKTVLTF